MLLGQVRRALHSLRAADRLVEGLDLLRVKPQRSQAVERLIVASLLDVDPQRLHDVPRQRPRGERETQLEDRGERVLQLYKILRAVAVVR